MNGELHQLLLLVSAANGYLHTRQYESLDGFDPRIFRIEFQGEDGRPLKSKNQADPVQTWLHDLKKKHCRGILAIQLGAGTRDRQQSGFAGGGRRWAMVARFRNFDEIWTADWRAEREDTHTYWQITYRCRRTHDFDDDAFDYNLERSRQRLELALTEIGRLADEIGEQHWKLNFFGPALHILNGQLHAETPLPAGYSEQAQRMYAAVYRSWVFGGMGSWNDVPPYSAHEKGKDQEFASCSDELYAAMQEALEAAVNESAVQE